MTEWWHYVLFPNHENAMKLYRLCKEKGLKVQISPTPRAASKCCGVSLLVKDESLLPEIESVIKEHQIEIWNITKLEKDINRKRDRYC